MNQHSLQYDSKLRGWNVWRYRLYTDPSFVHIECTPRLLIKKIDKKKKPIEVLEVVWVCFRSHLGERRDETKDDMTDLIFVSEGQWRTNPCRKVFCGVPEGTSFLFTGAPIELEL